MRATLKCPPSRAGAQPWSWQQTEGFRSPFCPALLPRWEHRAGDSTSLCERHVTVSLQGLEDTVEHRT